LGLGWLVVAGCAAGSDQYNSFEGFLPTSLSMTMTASALHVRDRLRLLKLDSAAISRPDHK
jgi:hypothetical protein